MKEQMKVEIWSDVMCPFCYIGKRRFENALEKLENKQDVEVVWKSFQLNPNTVTNPNLNATESLAKSKGWTIDYAREMSNNVTQMAAGEGLEYHFEKAVVANSFNAHRLLQFAKTLGKGDELKEALLHAYFTEGQNTDDAETLFALAAKAGLPADEAKNVIENKTLFAENVQADVAEAQRFGIQGVPFFVVDRKYGISGAQEVGAFSQTLEKAFGEWKSTQPEIKLETIDGAVCTPDGDCT